MLADHAPSGPDERDASGHVQDVRRSEARHLQQPGGNQGAFERSRAGLARLPTSFVRIGSNRHARKTAQDVGIDFRRDVVAFEPQFAAGRGVINARAQCVAD